MTPTLSIPQSLLPALTGALRFQIGDLEGCTHPETLAAVEDARTALALLARAQPHPDEARLDKLETYLADPDNTVTCPAILGQWELANNCSGSEGKTLRDAIDGL